MRRATRVVDEVAIELSKLINRAIRERLGEDSTFEQRQRLAAAVSSDSLWFREDQELREAITEANEVHVGGRTYQRLEQPSSATYYGQWGSHEIEEALYREVGVHNGPTIKPIELRLGLIEHMTPDMACVVGELSADKSSRGVERTLRVTGLVRRRRRDCSSRRKRSRSCVRLTETASLSSCRRRRPAFVCVALQHTVRR